MRAAQRRVGQPHSVKGPIPVRRHVSGGDCGASEGVSAPRPRAMWTRQRPIPTRCESVACHEGHKLPDHELKRKSRKVQSHEQIPPFRPMHFDTGQQRSSSAT